MNEDKKSRNDYFNPSVSNNEQNAQELYTAISVFLQKASNASFDGRPFLSAGDWLMLNKLLKQLKNTNMNLSKKVLRGIANRFENIRKNYQR